MTKGTIMIKKFIKKSFNILGYELRRFNEIDKTLSFDEIACKLINNISPHEIVIFDIGAHRGESVEKFKKNFPDSIIHSFEPDEENFKFLKDKFSGNVNIYLNNFGAGNFNGKQKFYRNVKTDTSSFNKVNMNSAWVKRRSERFNVKPMNFTTRTYDVDIRKLDDYIEEKSIERINVLKLDTQGYEDECLKGCIKTLKKNMIDIIETELIVGDVYNKSLSFRDIENIISPFNYSFYGIQNRGNLLEKPYLNLDLMYVRKELL